MQDISQDEVNRTEPSKQLKNGKAAGIDEIQPELLKYGESAVPYFTILCNQIWQCHTIPTEWRNGIIITLPKKGDLSECGNWHGITLLSVPGKVFASFLLDRIKEAVDKALCQEQAGFRPDRSDIHTATNLRESDSGP